jgi:hypothetical protein
MLEQADAMHEDRHEHTGNAADGPPDAAAAEPLAKTDERIVVWLAPRLERRLSVTVSTR